MGTQFKRRKTVRGWFANSRRYVDGEAFVDLHMDDSDEAIETFSAAEARKLGMLLIQAALKAEQKGTDP